MVPNTKCRLRLLKLERMKDYLLIEEEFIRNQEVLKPKEEKDKARRRGGMVAWWAPPPFGLRAPDRLAGQRTSMP